MLYLDASALVPCYAPEPGTAEMEALLVEADGCVISTLTLAEAQNALVRKAKHGRLTEAEMREAARCLDAHVADGHFAVQSVPDAVFAEVPRLSWQAPGFLRTADAAHLAMALRLGADLATYDLTLRAAAIALGVRVLPSPARAS
jgi:uncharacterized protein